MAPEDRVLVLGATSLVGRYLLPRLVAAGSSALALSRIEREAIKGVGWRVGDLNQPPTFEGVGAIGAVFSLSPIWLLTEAALEGLHRLGMRRLVAFSSTSQSTKLESGSQEERDTAAALAEGEARVERFCRIHNVGFTLLRPTLIYAEGQDGNVSRLAGLIRRFGVLPLPGGGSGLRQPVHADDLAVLALEAMKRPAADRAYDVPGAETLTYRVMVERIFEGLGRRPRIVSLPLPMVRFGYGLVRPWLPGSTVQMLERVGEDLVFDPTPVQRDFGWRPRGFRPRF